MRPRLPRSLAGQTIGLLILALLGSHLVGLAIYHHDRGEIVAHTEAHDLADRTVGLIHMMQQLPPLWHPDVARASDGRSLHVALGEAPDIVDDDIDEELSAEVLRYLRNQFVDWEEDRFRVGLSHTPLFEKERIHSNSTIIDPETRLSVQRPERQYNYLHISVRVDDTQWLSVVGALQKKALFRTLPAAAYLMSLVAGVTLIAVWMTLRVTSPLTQFTAAAERLGKDIGSEPLKIAGPREVSDAAEAFNTMQDRLRRLMQNRTQMLAAISHDLRTPVTLLRLRAEAIDDRRESEKLLATLDEMEVMIASVLEFTRATLLDEPQQQVDISALLSSICDDLSDAGAHVTCKVPGRTPYACRRISLKRALVNLLDNAVKYGERADVRLSRGEKELRITVCDDGPGIPRSQREHVFMPFHRVEGSRNAETGGIGLGLSIAQTIIHGHGGRIELGGRKPHGLAVTVHLPL